MQTNKFERNSCLGVALILFIVTGRSARVLFHHFDVEAERAEAVIAANHRAHGILHPAVVVNCGPVGGCALLGKEVSFSSGQRLHKLAHGTPSRKTHSFWALPVNGNPLLAFTNITGMLNRILVFVYQVVIDCLANGCYSYFIHTCGLLIAILYHVYHVSQLLCLQLEKLPMSAEHALEKVSF